MPELSQDTVSDLRKHLKKLVIEKYPGSRVEDEPIGVGGSAAVFRVSSDANVAKAFKLLDPRFSSGNFADAAERRIELQRQFLEHECKALIQFDDLFLFDGVYVTIMEDLPWDELKMHVGSIPDKNIVSIIAQIVEVIKLLESKGMIHRDLKPENILISPDKAEIRVIDLGVLREISPDEDRIDLTDLGDHRPFLATAQYSSPEYLFRIKAPSKDLWRALNIYQLGAIVFDLINGSQIFSDSMAKGNRYALALDVLTKKPLVSEKAHNNFPTLAKLCGKALSKDPDFRLKSVSIEEFVNFQEQDLSKKIEMALDTLVTVEDKNKELSHDNTCKVEEGLTLFCEEVKAALITKYSPKLQFETRPRNGDKGEANQIVVLRGTVEICNCSISTTAPTNGIARLHTLILTVQAISETEPLEIREIFDPMNQNDPVLCGQICDYIEISILRNLDQILDKAHE